MIIGMAIVRPPLSQKASPLARFRASTCAIALALAATASGCLGSDLGVAGGEESLSKKFAGVESATVISPSAVTVKWKPLSNYTNYNIYVSTQDAPVGTS